MDRLEFEAELRRDGYSVVNASLTPNLKVANHCHDFDARLFVLGGEITITRDNRSETFRAGQCCEVLANCMHADVRDTFRSDLRGVLAIRRYLAMITGPKRFRSAVSRHCDLAAQNHDAHVEVAVRMP